MISPVGYPAEKWAVSESLMRAGMRSEKRKPWKDLFFHNTFSEPLYAKITEGKGETDPAVIQRVDAGICANHFHLAAQERGLSGTLKRLPEPENTGAPMDYRYLFSWTN